MKRSATCLGVVAVLAGALVGLAGTTRAGGTSIVPDKSVGTTVTVTAKGSLYTINGGTLAGSNLFESFAAFSLAAGATARWTYGDPSNISNVINRVTGGSPSYISGTLDSTRLPHAAFWFINPAGIVFGKGAHIDVPAAAYFSTAQRLYFGDGKILNAVTPTGSTLSMAEPSAFGFLGGQGGVTINGVTEARALGPLFLAGANLNLSNTSLQTAGLDLIAVGGAARIVTIANPLAGAPFAGEINVSGSRIVTLPAPDADGSIYVGGDTVMIAGGSSDGLLTQAGTKAPAGAFSLKAQGLTIERGARVGSITETSQDAGPIDIKAADIVVTAASQIESNSDGAGNAGALSIEVGELTVQYSAKINALSKGEGTGGNVFITADVLTVQHQGGIGVGAFKSGAAGNLTIDVDGPLVIQNSGFLGADSSGPGNGGVIHVDAQSMTIQRGGRVEATAFSSGIAGDIIICADDISVNGNGAISTDTYATGNAGILSIDAADVLIVDHGIISSEARPASTGVAGSLTIDAGALAIRNSGRVLADNFGPKQAGDVNITAQTMTVDDLGGIGAFASRQAGNLAIEVNGDLIIRDNGFIHADSSGAGLGGSITVHAKVITIQNGGNIAVEGLSSGNAGNIALAANAVLVDGAGSRVSSANLALDGGGAGAIQVVTGPLTLSNGGAITTNSASGRAGDISLTFNHGGLLVLEGAQQPGQITTTSGTNTGGKIEISGPSAIVLNGGLIQALGPDNLASADIQAGSVIESGDRPNGIAVAGRLVLDSKIVDVSQAVTQSSISFEDASKVLRGQCPTLRARGETSQLGTGLYGPYGPAPMGGPPPPPGPRQIASRCGAAFRSP